MARSKSSGRWLQEHEDDEFVRRARAEGYRSRAVYKLLEIQDKYQLIRPGTTLIDLGAAPGGWSQVAARLTKGNGRIIALDLLEIDPLAEVEFIQGDFTEDVVLNQLLATLQGTQVDLVISDMAPNLSGNKAIDQPRAAYLVELAVDLADQVLKRGGSLLIKCFEGEGIEDIRRLFSDRFAKTHNVKPRASRNRSREIYLLGTGYTDKSI